MRPAREALHIPQRTNLKLVGGPTTLSRPRDPHDWGLDALGALNAQIIRPRSAGPLGRNTGTTGSRITLRSPSLKGSGGLETSR